MANEKPSGGRIGKNQNSQKGRIVPRERQEGRKAEEEKIIAPNPDPLSPGRGFFSDNGSKVRCVFCLPFVYRDSVAFLFFRFPFRLKLTYLKLLLPFLSPLCLPFHHPGY
jgi:hypothetical protein